MFVRAHLYTTLAPQVRSLNILSETNCLHGFKSSWDALCLVIAALPLVRHFSQKISLAPRIWVEDNIGWSSFGYERKNQMQKLGLNCHFIIIVKVIIKGITLWGKGQEGLKVMLPNWDSRFLPLPCSWLFAPPFVFISPASDCHTKVAHPTKYDPGGLFAGYNSSGSIPPPHPLLATISK